MLALGLGFYSPPVFVLMAKRPVSTNLQFLQTLRGHFGFPDLKTETVWWTGDKLGPAPTEPDAANVENASIVPKRGMK